MSGPALVFGAALLAQVVTIPPAQAPLTQNRAPVRADPPPGMPTAPSARVDRWFAVAASEGSSAELAMAQLALQRSHADEVKAFARTMIAEHMGLMRALAPQLRRTLGKMPPRELAPGDALTYYRLAHASDVEFDQTYMLAQSADISPRSALSRPKRCTVPIPRSSSSSGNGHRRCRRTFSSPST